jgi:hypothetical protein
MVGVYCMVCFTRYVSQATYADLLDRMTFVGSSMQGIAYYILSQLVVWEVDFPGGVDINNIKFRAVVWAVSEVLLIMVVALNYLPRKPFWQCQRSSIDLERTI